jgi:hypothetical protein
MSGDLVDPATAKPGDPPQLQKPFRVSDVLAILRETLSGSPAGKIQP